VKEKKEGSNKNLHKCFPRRFYANWAKSKAP